MVGSAQANVFAVVSAGICALWGPLHGGANESVLDMLEEIHKDGGRSEEVHRACQEEGLGFQADGLWPSGVQELRSASQDYQGGLRQVLSRLKIKDPLLDIARTLEEAALRIRISSSASSIPTSTSTVHRLSRTRHSDQSVYRHVRHRPATGLAGAWKEMHEDPSTKIGRPRQIYYRTVQSAYVPIEQRR